MNEDNQPDARPSMQDAASYVMEPEHHKNAKGILGLVFLLLLIVIGAISYVLIPDNNDTTDTAANSQEQAVATTPEQEKQTTATEQQPAATTLTQYLNEEYGFSFGYPESWGEVEIDRQEGSQGAVSIGSFTNASQVQFGVASADHQPFGRDGGCNVVFIGVTKSDELADYDIKEDSTTQQGDEKDSSYRVIRSTEFASEDRIISNTFEAGTVEGLGGCLGYSSQAIVFLSDNEDTLGVRFSYNQRDNQLSSVPYEWGDQFIAAPEDFYSSSVRDGYIELVKSLE